MLVHRLYQAAGTYLQDIDCWMQINVPAAYKTHPNISPQYGVCPLITLTDDTLIDIRVKVAGHSCDVSYLHRQIFPN